MDDDDVADEEMDGSCGDGCAGIGIDDDDDNGDVSISVGVNVIAQSYAHIFTRE